MDAGKRGALWILRLTSAAVFLLVCYELLQWLPVNDDPFEGMTATVVLFFWLGANVLGLILGLLISKRVAITPQITLSILWSGVVCAAYLVSKIAGPEIHNLTALNYTLVVTFLSIPLVGGLAWAQNGALNYKVASNLGVTK